MPQWEGPARRPAAQAQQTVRGGGQPCHRARCPDQGSSDLAKRRLWRSWRLPWLRCRNSSSWPARERTRDLVPRSRSSCRCTRPRRGIREARTRDARHDEPAQYPTDLHLL